MRSLLLLLLSLMVFVTACGQKDKTIQMPQDALPEEIEIPIIPESIKEPTQRADYVLAHFWDSVDFTNPKWIADTAMLEQNFANYIQFFPYGTPKGGLESAAALLHKTAVNPKAFDMLIMIADKYLYDPNSPMKDEKAYSYFLETLLSMEGLTPERRDLYTYQLSEVKLNAPGTKVSDFTFIDRDGNTQSLYSFIGKSPFTLLGFYDPECDHCKDIIGMMRNSEGLSSDIRDGKIEVIAIYSGDNLPLWNASKSGMPANWLIGYDLTGVEEKDLYINRAMPTFYLLDKDFNVLTKDIQVQTILQMTAQK